MFIITFIGIIIICSIVIIEYVKPTIFYKRKESEDQRLAFLIKSIYNSKTVTEYDKDLIITLIEVVYKCRGIQDAYEVYYSIPDLNRIDNCIIDNCIYY